MSSAALLLLLQMMKMMTMITDAFISP